MRRGAIIENSKVVKVVDTALYKVKEPVSMVSVDRYDKSGNENHGTIEGARWVPNWHKL